MGCVCLKPAALGYDNAQIRLDTIPSSDYGPQIVNDWRSTIDEIEDWKQPIREIESQNKEQHFTLNMVTVRVSNEICLLMQRNFPNESNFYDSVTQQTKRLGSWWYSVLKHQQFSGIVMQNNMRIDTTFSDNLQPSQTIEHKIEVISGIFWTKVDFEDTSSKMRFTVNDFENYMNNKEATANPHFSEIGYDQKSNSHMVSYQNINQQKGNKCVTDKDAFEYTDNLSTDEVQQRMAETLTVSEEEMENCYIYVDSQCTDKEYRRKGIANILWLKLFNLYSKGTKFGLYVRFDNKIAQGMYFKLGFKHIGSEKDFYEKGVDAWKMVLVL